MERRGHLGLPCTSEVGAAAEVHSQQSMHVTDLGDQRGSPCAGEVGAAAEVQAGEREECAEGA